MGRGYVLKVNLMILFLSLFMINMCTISIYWLRPKWLPFPHIRHYFWPEPKVWNYSNTRNQTNSIVPSFVKSALSLSRSWEGILQPSADGGGASCYPSRALPCLSVPQGTITLSVWPERRERPLVRCQTLTTVSCHGIQMTMGCKRKAHSPAWFRSACIALCTCGQSRAYVLYNSFLTQHMALNIPCSLQWLIPQTQTWHHVRGKALKLKIELKLNVRFQVCPRRQ